MTFPVIQKPMKKKLQTVGSAKRETYNRTISRLKKWLVVDVNNGRKNELKRDNNQWQTVIT